MGKNNFHRSCLERINLSWFVTTLSSAKTKHLLGILICRHFDAVCFYGAHSFSRGNHASDLKHAQSFCRCVHKDNNSKHQKLSTLDVLSQRKMSNPVQTRCKESQCLLRYPPSKTCKAHLAQWILFVYVYLQFDQENASHAQSAETRHTFCMDQWHAERTKHFQGRHRQFC